MIHHLMIGTWTPPGAIYTVAFDEEALTLSLVQKTEIPHDEPVSWMTFDHAKKNIYGAALKKWSSFSVKGPTDIVHRASHPMDGDPLAADASTRTRAIFLLAAKRAPYHVYCNPFYEHAGYGNVFSVETNDTATTSTSAGTLATNVQNYAYGPDSAVHGMVFDAAEEHLYSADMWADRVWTHRKDARTGLLERVGWTDAPRPGDHPRWVEMHPDGGYLYVLMEAGNRLAVYAIDGATRMPAEVVGVYPLIPEGMWQLLPTDDNPISIAVAKSRIALTVGEQLYLALVSLAHTLYNNFANKVLLGADKSLYRADVVILSPSRLQSSARRHHLFATSRSNRTESPGYISGFALEPDGRVARQLFLQPTTTSGGHSNAISAWPCSSGCGSGSGSEGSGGDSGSDDVWLALTDDVIGGVEILRFRAGKARHDDGKEEGKDASEGTKERDGEGSTGLEVVARLDIRDPGFGMNAIWYD